MTVPRTSSRAGQPCDLIDSGKVANVAAHPVRSQDLALLENRENFGVDRVELVVAEGNGPRRQAGQGIGFELDQDQDRNMARVGGGPHLDLPKRVDERRRRRSEVDVRHVQDLEPRLAKHTAGIRVFARILALHLNDCPGRGLCEQAALGVGVDIQLDLPDPQLSELIGQRAMRVIERLRRCALRETISSQTPFSGAR